MKTSIGFNSLSTGREGEDEDCVTTTTSVLTLLMKELDTVEMTSTQPLELHSPKEEWEKLPVLHSLKREWDRLRMELD